MVGVSSRLGFSVFTLKFFNLLMQTNPMFASSITNTSIFITDVANTCSRRIGRMAAADTRRDHEGHRDYGRLPVPTMEYHRPAPVDSPSVAQSVRVVRSTMWALMHGASVARGSDDSY